MPISYLFTINDEGASYYLDEAEDYGFPPSNSTPDPVPPRPWVKTWAERKNGTWEMVEDHRERKPPYFKDEFFQEATPFWLPGEGDDWQSPPRTMKEPGPLPEGAVLAQPEKPLSAAQDEKRREINAAHGEVLSYLLAESPNPTPVEAALAVEDMRADDPEGLGYVRSLADARRVELLAAVDTAPTVADVENIAVTYPV